MTFDQFMAPNYRQSDYAVNRQTVVNVYQNSDMTFGERLKQCRKDSGLSQAAVAKRVGMSQANLSDLENGKFPSSSYTPRLAKLYGVNALWLADGIGPIQASAAIRDGDKASLTQAELSNVRPGPPIRGKVPLISWVQAGIATEAVDLLQPGEGMDWIDTTCPIGRYTYALQIEGDSMAPFFPPGTVIVVEPDLEARSGDYVIAKNGNEEVTFKQLVKDGGQYYLRPINERYPIQPLGEFHVIGVVREAVRRFR